MLLVLIFCIFISANYMADTKHINCNAQIKCSTVEDIVWATDNKQCYLFRNPCIFSREVCNRKEQEQEELKNVTREECQKYCYDMCTADFAPVCGDYVDGQKTFSNMCEFYNYSCHNNKSYIFQHFGECIQAVPA